MKKKTSMKFSTVFCIISFLFLTSTIHFAEAQSPQANNFNFIENGGQWPDHVIACTDIGSGKLFLEKGGITVNLVGYDETLEASKNDSEALHQRPNIGHVYKVNFEGSIAPSNYYGEQESSAKYSYFLGNDKSKWAGGLSAFGKFTIENVYPNIDFRIFDNGSNLKYEFVVKDGGNPTDVKLAYSGIDNFNLDEEGNLILETNVGQVTEKRPDYYFENGTSRSNIVAGSYNVAGNSVTFNNLPNKVLTGQRLVIDPVLIFCSYSGSVADNFGYTAAPDSKGNLYAGSVVYGTAGADYPTTPGAYDETFNSENGTGSDGGFGTDIAISKFSADGKTLVYSTYIGGLYDDVVHSLITDSEGQLYFLGTTASKNFPVSSGAFQAQHNGGPNINGPRGLPPSTTATSIRYKDDGDGTGGADLVICKLSANGDQLLASTYFGGNKTDGVVMIHQSQSGQSGLSYLRYNYADEYRGEIELDEQGNVYIASCTASPNLPVTANAVQSNLDGNRLDGILLKFNNNLSNLLYCSYFGGNNDDAIYSLELLSNGDMLFGGGTGSSNLPVTPNAYQSNFAGGNVDGFMGIISADGSTIKSCTYYGTVAYDQIYFVESDNQDMPHCFGQTNYIGQTYFTQNTTIGQPTSGQFISKFETSLVNRNWSLTFGAGDARGTKLSPTAFLVDVCNKIFLSGWGSADLGNGGLNNFPVVDPLITNDSESSFYIMMIDADATVIKFASHFGDPSSSDHVDGGTSRFDKQGNVYQAVCAGCGGSSSFPTTPGAVSETNGATNCNLGVFKIDFIPDNVIANFEVESVICPNSPVEFTNTSVRATSFNWKFGDGQESTTESPTHFYANPGVYNITLIAYNPNTCNEVDSTSREIVILNNEKSLGDEYLACSGDVIQIGITPKASPLITYSWIPTTNLVGHENASNPYLTVADSSTYILKIEAGQCSDSLIFNINVPTPPSILPDTITFCEGLEVTLSPDFTDNCTNFKWYDNPSKTTPINTIGVNSVIVSPNDEQLFYLEFDYFGCPYSDVIKTVFREGTVQAKFTHTNVACFNSLVGFTNESINADSYDWDFGDLLSASTENPTHTYISRGLKIVVLTITGNAENCFAQDQFTSELNIIGFELIENKTIDACVGDTIVIGINSEDSLDATYEWFPKTKLFTPNNVNSELLIKETYYDLVIKIEPNCADTTKYTLNTVKHSTDPISDVTFCLGDELNITAGTQQGSTDHKWYNEEGVLLTENQTLTFSPDSGDIYYLEFKYLGCDFSDSLIAQGIHNPLDASFNVTPVNCLNLNINFTNTSKPGGIANSFWDFDELGATSTAVSPNHVFTTTGKHTVMLVQSETFQGCAYTDTAYNEVYILQDKLIGSNDLQACPLDTLNIGISVGDSLPVSYRWEPTTGLFTPNRVSSNFEAQTSITYLLIAEAGNCADTIAYNTEVVSPPDNLPIEYITCLQDTTTLNAGLPVGATNVIWTNEYTRPTVLNVNGEDSIKVLPNKDTKYYVQFDYINCVSFDSTIVKPITLGVKANYINEELVCNALSISFTNTSSVADYFYWNFDDNTTSTLKNPSHTFPNLGVYNIKLLATKQDLGCTEKDSIIQQLVLTNNTLTYVDTVTLCQDDSIQIGITPITSKPVTYLWTPNTDLAPSNDVSMVTVWPTDTAEYWLILEGPGCRDTLITTVDVTPKIINLTDTIHFCLGDDVLLDPTLNTEAKNFKWYQKGSLAQINSTGEKEVTLSPAHTTTYFLHYQYHTCIFIDSITLNPLGADLITGFEIDPILCIGTSYTIQNTSENASSFKWVINDTLIFTDESPVYTFSTQGKYKVKLIVTAGEPQCAIKDSLTVTTYVLNNSKAIDSINVCSNTPTQIGIEPYTNMPVTYHWNPEVNLDNPAISNPVLTTNTSNTYTLEISGGSCVDTLITVVTIPQVADLLPNYAEICLGDTFWLQIVMKNYDVIRWYDAPTKNDTINPNGNDSVWVVPTDLDGHEYYVEIEYLGCPFEDNIFIEAKDLALALNANDEYCFYDTISALANISKGIHTKIQWSPIGLDQLGNDTISHYISDTTFMLHCEVGSSVCRVSDSIRININSLNPKNYDLLIKDTVYYYGDHVDVEVIPNIESTTYYWLPAERYTPFDASRSFFEITEDTRVRVELSQDGCLLELQKEVKLEINPCGPPDIFVPNAFTPNNDGNNDLLKVRGQFIESLQFRIYDRWGEKVFDVKSQDQTWDGTYKGELLDPSVYVYYLEAICINKKTYTEKGNITLMR